MAATAAVRALVYLLALEPWITLNEKTKFENSLSHQIRRIGSQRLRFLRVLATVIFLLDNPYYTSRSAVFIPAPIFNLNFS